jgi:GNAT superfamily N-acetyltransferase
MELTIRKALPEDAEKLTDCLITCWSSAYKGIIPDDYLNNMVAEREHRVERWRNNISNPGDCEHYCVIFNDRTIGWLTIHKVDGEVWAIYLLEEFCGQGYGKRVFDFAINRLKELKHKQIYLWVFEDNMRARRFYEKCAFNLNGEKREMTYGKPLVQLKYSYAL